MYECNGKYYTLEDLKDYFSKHSFVTYNDRDFEEWLSIQRIFKEVTLPHKFAVGETVKYLTMAVKYLDGTKKDSEEKEGKIEECLFTIDKRACYWIEKENELIMEQAIIGITT